MAYRNWHISCKFVLQKSTKTTSNRRSMEELAMIARFERLPILHAVPRSIFGFERDLNELFEGFLAPGFGVHTAEYPQLNVTDSGTEFELVAELPGVKKEDLKVSVQDGVLTITGERKAADLPENSRYVRS